MPHDPSPPASSGATVTIQWSSIDRLAQLLGVRVRYYGIRVDYDFDSGVVRSQTEPEIRLEWVGWNRG